MSGTFPGLAPAIALEMGLQPRLTSIETGNFDHRGSQYSLDQAQFIYWSQSRCAPA